MESSPEHMVFQALQAACCQDTVLLKQAEEKLAEWETQPGFHRILLQIILSIELDVTVRWMAAVYFKNGVNKFWRVNAKNEIQLDEKCEIRRELISHFQEPVPQIAIQIAVLIGKIARFDCPKEWPELIPSLTRVVTTESSVQQHRALLVLHQVIKTLASKRMMADKRIFEAVTENVYYTVLHIFDQFTTSFYGSIRTSSPEDAAMFLEKATLALRILKKCTIFGFQRPHKCESCLLFIDSIFTRLRESLQLRYEFKVNNQPISFMQNLEKFILKKIKTLNDFLEHHPLSFAQFIPTALEFSFHFAFDTGLTTIFVESKEFLNFPINCINLMKNILSSTAYSASASESYKNDEVTLAIEKKNHFFTNERLRYICEKLIAQYFVLTESELSLWEEDPEAYICDETGESWKYTLRPCAETFLATLFTNFRTELTTEVGKHIQKVQQKTLTQESDINEILLKDAVYNTAGISAFNLYDEVDFNSWFTSQLCLEIAVKSSVFRIVRRRVIWLIGKWSGVQLFKDLRPKVYELCVNLLAPTEDMVVRLESAKTLMATLDDFEFESTSFLPYLESSFSSLFLLLKESKECETKMSILNIMSFLIDKMSDDISSHAENLLTYLPRLWEESAEFYMLRCAIISTLQQIVRALCDVPTNIVPILYGIIGISTNVKDSCHIYLIEEGLDLWLAVLENSQSLQGDLLNLSENLLPIIESSSENLRIVLLIMEAYVILSPQQYLHRYGKSIVATCSYLLDDLRQEGIVMILRLFETFLRAEGSIGLELLKPVLPKIYIEICNNTHFPMVLTSYLAIIARVLMLNNVVFITALQEANIGNNSFEILLDVWLQKMPLITQSEKRKLLSLALTNLLTVYNDIVFMRFSVILQNISECLNDIMREDCDGDLTDALLCDDETQIEDIDYKTYHNKRCRQLCMIDPVHRIVLVDYLKCQVSNVRSNLGEEKYKTLIATTDINTLKRLSNHVDIFSDTVDA